MTDESACNHFIWENREEERIKQKENHKNFQKRKRANNENPSDLVFSLLFCFLCPSISCYRTLLLFLHR